MINSKFSIELVQRQYHTGILLELAGDIIRTKYLLVEYHLLMREIQMNQHFLKKYLETEHND